jgi:transposase-like protein
MKHNEQLRIERMAMVESWRQSGLTVHAYSQLHHISPHTLGYWWKQARKKASGKVPVASQPAFVPLKIKSSAISRGSVFCELVTLGGKRLLFHQPVDPRFLKALVD